MAAAVEEVAELIGLDQGPRWGGQRDTMRKSALLEINLGQAYYSYCDLKRYGKLSNAASFLRDIKDLRMQICAFYTTKIL